MKRTRLFLMLATAALLASCGGSSLDPEEAGVINEIKDGIMGGDVAEIVQRHAEIEALRQEAKDIMKAGDEAARTARNEQEEMENMQKTFQGVGELQEKVDKACLELDERAEELQEKIEGMELDTELADDIPLKLVRPFKVTDFKWKPSAETMGFMPMRSSGYGTINMAAIVKLTQDRPRITDWQRRPSDYYLLKLALVGDDGEATDTLSVKASAMTTADEVKAGTEIELSFSCTTESKYIMNPDNYLNRLYTAKALRIIWEHPLQETDNSAFYGDLGIFGLRGPVMRCTWKTFGDTWVVTFNRLGEWTSESGRDTFSNFPQVTRNEEGRIVKLSDNYDEQRMTFTYNDKGLVVRSTIEFMDGGGETTYEYDDEGFAVKETDSYADYDGQDVDTNVFTIVERDEYNNWTRRVNQDGKAQTRTIVYYRE